MNNNVAIAAPRVNRSRRLFSRQYSPGMYLDAFERSGLDEPAWTPKTGNPFTGTRLVSQVISPAFFHFVISLFPLF